MTDGSADEVAADGDVEPEDAILEVRDLVKRFTARRRGHSYVIQAVDGITLSVLRGETLGIVGESGCGKSTLGRLIVRLSDADEGEVIFNGRDLLSHGRRDLREARLKIRMIFQDPYASLNPRRSVGDSIAESGDVHGLFRDRRERTEGIHRTLDQVGLDGSFATRYPHELSGGQRQRVGIARAILPTPEMIIADEPVSALDVSVQAQVLNLLSDLKERLGLTMMFISHDLGVVATVSDRVAVLYMGMVVELAAADRLFDSPRHPYTEVLLAAIPRLDIANRITGETEGGEPPSRFRQASGCPFKERCPKRSERCESEVPLLRRDEHGHAVACHNV